jgi:hypothetical protein
MIARALLFIAAWLAGALLVILYHLRVIVDLAVSIWQWHQLKGKTRREVREAMG